MKLSRVKINKTERNQTYNQNHKLNVCIVVLNYKNILRIKYNFIH